MGLAATRAFAGSRPPARPNVVFILVDQLRAQELSAYGGKNIPTPALDQLAKEGIVFDQAFSTCPICTPYPGMLLTGRYPQSTGIIENNIRTRHDEVSVADAFGKAGYRTGYIGKWHLYSDPAPRFREGEYIPDGRDRLGFDYFRGYNYHVNYMDGQVCLDDGAFGRWKGYETEGLLEYFDIFLDGAQSDPFCVFLSVHQPHHGGGVGGGKKTHDTIPGNRLAPPDCMNRVPEQPVLPPNVKLQGEKREENLHAYQDYLGMTVACDDMVADVMRRLRERGLLDNTLVVFTSDHGSMMGSQGEASWLKCRPYEESIHVPLIVRFPDKKHAGTRSSSIVAPVDLYPTLASLCAVPVPGEVEGLDLSGDWLSGDPKRSARDALLTMYISNVNLQSGSEWRGIRTQEWNYYRFRANKKRRGLFNIKQDPHMLNNLSGKPEFAEIEAELEARMLTEMAALGDDLVPASDYKGWFDDKRQVIGNARGPLPPGYISPQNASADSGTRLPKPNPAFKKP